MDSTAIVDNKKKTKNYFHKTHFASHYQNMAKILSSLD